MTYLTNLIDLENICPLAGLIMLVCFVGAMMVSQRPELNHLGTVFAGAAFIVFVLYLGFTHRPDTASEWLSVTIRGLLAAALTLGASWIVLAAISVTNDFVVSPFTRKTKSFRSAVRDWLRHRRAQRLKERTRREQEEARRREQEEWERTAPERERQRLLEEARQRQEQLEEAIRLAAQERQERPERRYQACHEILIYFATHEPNIHHRLPLSRIESLLMSFIRHAASSDEIERNTERLKALVDVCVMEHMVYQEFEPLREVIEERLKRHRQEPHDYLSTRTDFEEFTRDLQDADCSMPPDNITAATTELGEQLDAYKAMLQRYYEAMKPGWEEAQKEEIANREVAQRQEARDRRDAQISEAATTIERNLRAENPNATQEEIQQTKANMLRDWVQMQDKLGKLQVLDDELEQ